VTSFLCKFLYFSIIKDKSIALARPNWRTL